MELLWHHYKYYPYEKDLALREAKALLSPRSMRTEDNAVRVEGSSKKEAAERLVYFAGFGSSSNAQPTKQALLERINGNGPKKQSTRYSSHGLHEYKGKFNPQIAKLLLNIFGMKPGNRVLDPFCGSGTSLVECAHLGIESVGTDINPLAVFLANAKLLALSTPAKPLLKTALEVLASAKRSRLKQKADDARSQYLASWFEWDHLSQIERLKASIESSGFTGSNILLAVASNLLREYSDQEPQDLRIRRRKSPYPEISFFDAYERSVRLFCGRLEDSQSTLGIGARTSVAVHCDCRNLAKMPELDSRLFDAALTSPPYATALPYIDTQRLSLVWLGLVDPPELLALEAELVGSREIRGRTKASLLTALESNEALLPTSEIELCRQLQNALSEGDGFRRQALPPLLYRYFVAMSESFETTRKLLRKGAHFGLIVGGNHTTLGGRRFDIDTPAHLASLASANGWSHAETIPLQTYQRFGLHASNATTTESLVILTAK
nr:DNA methyltransferase [uncultured Pseudoxanthomonas sp.]